MSFRRIPLRVGEVIQATVRRKLSDSRVLIKIKGQSLVAEPEQPVAPGDAIDVQVLSIFPRIRLRLLPGGPASGSRSNPIPVDLQT